MTKLWPSKNLSTNDSNLYTCAVFWTIKALLNRRSNFRCNVVRWKESRWSCLKWGSTNVLTFSESNRQDALFETKLVFCFYSVANFRGLEHGFGNVPYLIMVHLPIFFFIFFFAGIKFIAWKIWSKNSKPTMQFWLLKRLFRNKNYKFAFGSSLTHYLNVLNRTKFNNSLFI